MPDGDAFQSAATKGLEHLLQVADEFGARLLERTIEQAIMAVSPPVHGGGAEEFRLLLSQDGKRVTVREEPGRNRLPTACPMRHVNLGGSFCLGWEDEDPSEVADDKGARSWWRVLLIFLGHQLYADACRRWPHGQERAHGGAALHEARAEALAERFGPSFLADLRTGRLRLRRVARSSRLERDGRRVFAIRDGAAKVANLRAACPCDTDGRRLVLKACSNHAPNAANLIRAMQAWEKEETSFYKSFSKQTRCCGTMCNCPMADHEPSIAKAVG